MLTIVKKELPLHNIKIEDLEMSRDKADAIETVIHNFLTDLGYSNDRIEALECRSRDGFAAYSHNKGGLGAIAYMNRNSLPNGMLGFKNADATILKYEQYDIESFAEENKLDASKFGDWSESQHEEFRDYQMNDESSDILLSVDVMLTGDDTLNVRMCVCVKDAPYHRKYDDLIEFDVSFKTVKSLENKLKKLLTNKEVKQFSKNLTDAY